MSRISELLAILLQLGSDVIRPPGSMPDSTPVALGDAVRLAVQRPYLKTADPMPMLRPGDLIAPDEVGQVVGLRAAEQVAVRFRRGTFLLETSWLSPA